MSVFPGPAWRPLVLALLPAMTASPASAHLALYHIAEVHLTDPSVVTVRFTVHAPEVMLDPAVDLSDYGDAWLASLDDDTVAELVRRSRLLIEDLYHLSIPGGVDPSLEGLRFESAELIRTPGREDAPRPGCIRATLEFPNPGGACSLHFGAEAAKRLLLAEMRPRSFPITHDVAPGETVDFALSSPPSSPASRLQPTARLAGEADSRPGVLAWIAPLAALLLGLPMLVFVLRRRFLS